MAKQNSDNQQRKGGKRARQRKSAWRRIGVMARGGAKSEHDIRQNEAENNGM